MSNRIYLDVWDAMNKEYVEKGVTVDRACTIIGCKYSTIMAHRKDERLICGRYVIRESADSEEIKKAKEEKPVKKLDEFDELAKRPLSEWIRDWNRIRRGANLLATRMGVIGTGSDGKKYVYSVEYLRRGGKL